MSIRQSEAMDALGRAMSETFEGLAFAQVFEAITEDGAPQLAGDELGCILDIPDPLGMRLMFVMTAEQTLEVFSQVSGLALDQIQPAMLDDFVKEVTNTIAGHLHTLLVPDAESMLIGLPRGVTPEELRAETQPAPERLVVRYQVEEYAVWVALCPVTKANS